MSRSSAPMKALKETCFNKWGDSPTDARSSRIAARQLKNRSASDNSRRQASEGAAGERPSTLWLRPMKVRKSMAGAEIKIAEGFMGSQKGRERGAEGGRCRRPRPKYPSKCACLWQRRDG